MIVLLWVTVGFSIHRVHPVVAARLLPRHCGLCVRVSLLQTLIWIPPETDTAGGFKSSWFIWEASAG